jgi:hypothetical protein
MKKLFASVALGFVFSTVPVAIYAACADDYTVDLGSSMRHCTLTGSSGGGTICYYACSNVPKDKEAPAEQQTVSD